MGWSPFSFLLFHLLRHKRCVAVVDFDLPIPPMTPPDRPRSIWPYALAFALVLATSCHRRAAPSHSFDGTWMMKLGDRVLCGIKLEPQRNGSFVGSIRSPKSF